MKIAIYLVTEEMSLDDVKRNIAEGYTPLFASICFYCYLELKNRVLSEFKSEDIEDWLLAIGTPDQLDKLISDLLKEHNPVDVLVCTDEPEFQKFTKASPLTDHFDSNWNPRMNN
jgi:hypothetical protein